MSGLGHVVHFIIFLLFWPWLFVWILCALCCSSSSKKREMAMKKEELELLKQIVKQNKGGK